jgi:hypothetical protein
MPRNQGRLNSMNVPFEGEVKFLSIVFGLFRQFLDITYPSYKISEERAGESKGLS